MAKVLDGKTLAAAVRAGLSERIRSVSERRGRPPGLAVLLVGDDPGSAVYVRNKEKASKALGMFSEVVRLPATASEAEIVAAVEALNARAEVDAFLVQSPLPDGVDEAAVVERIDPAKDADGLHPLNLGRLLAGMPAPRPCTPSGVMALLALAETPLVGAHAVVVGRSTIVGKPMALMLLEQHATVTLCHSRTRELAAEVGRADIVVAAVGSAELIRGAWVKPGATVIDVGINRVGDKLKGDVEFEAAAARAAAITPVPGGVGPLTVAMLLANTVTIAERA